MNISFIADILWKCPNQRLSIVRRLRLKTPLVLQIQNLNKMYCELGNYSFYHKKCRKLTPVRIIFWLWFFRIDIRFDKNCKWYYSEYHLLPLILKNSLSCCFASLIVGTDRRELSLQWFYSKLVKMVLGSYTKVGAPRSPRGLVKS